MGGSPLALYRWLRLRWLAGVLSVPFAGAGCVNGAFDLSWRGAGSSSDETTPSPPGEPLQLLAAGATEASVRDTIESFEAESGLSVEFEFGPVGALRDRVLAGESANVLVVTPAIITTLEAEQRVRAGSRVDLGRIGGGIAVRAGDPLPAIKAVPAVALVGEYPAPLQVETTYAALVLERHDTLQLVKFFAGPRRVRPQPAVCASISPIGRPRSRQRWRPCGQVSTAEFAARPADILDHFDEAQPSAAARALERVDVEDSLIQRGPS